MPSGIDQNKAATVVLGVLGAKRITQTEAARGVGINKVYMSGFLTRKVNLLDDDLHRLFEFLGVQNVFAMLSTPADKI